MGKQGGMQRGGARVSEDPGGGGGDNMTLGLNRSMNDLLPRQTVMDSRTRSHLRAMGMVGQLQEPNPQPESKSVGGHIPDRHIRNSKT